MFDHPRIKSSFHVHPVSGKFLFLLDEHRKAILEGIEYYLLAPLLDGHRSVPQMIAEVAGEVPFHRVYAALHRLEQGGYLVEGPEPQGDGLAPLAEYFHSDPSRVDWALTKAGVSVRALGGLNPERLSTALADRGIAVGDALTVVLTPDYLEPELAEVDRSARQLGHPWLPLKPVGSRLWIGPLMIPGQTGCWHCMAQRLRANRQIEGYIQERRPGPSVPLCCAFEGLDPGLEIACRLAAQEVAKWLLVPEASRLPGKLWEWDLVGHELKEHVLVRRPQCQACGTPLRRDSREGHPPRLQGHPKRFREDGGHRSMTPEETYARYQHHISPLLGAVTELKPALGPQSELTQTFVAGHNFSMGVDSIVFLKESVRGMSGGKGSTRIQAMVSGLCEAIERYSGLYRGDEPSFPASFLELGGSAIHPNAIMGFSESQYLGREAWNRSQPDSRCHLVTNPFPEDLTIHWTPVWSMTHQRTRHLPTAMLYYGHPEFKVGRWCSPDSNGSAAGNTLEEAILQGFMELVERDAVAIWWYNRLQRPAVDLDSFNLPYIDAIRDYYRGLNREIWVLDITSDLGICTLACVSRCTDRPVEDLLIGFGSHFDPRIALLRAITEVNQFLPTVSLRNADGSTRYLFGDDLAKQWWTTARLAEHPYLTPHPQQPATRSEEFHNPATDDLKRDVELCVELCRQREMELLLLDQTQPDIGLNVVKMIVPQLCHFWRRFGKKRLFEIPVDQGWLERSHREEELNPHSIFF